MSRRGVPNRAKEGRRRTKVDRVFGKEALAGLGAKKLKPGATVRKEDSIISRARRRYVLGQDEALAET